MENTAINYAEVMQHFGTRYRLAKRLGLGVSAAYNWPKGTVPRRYHTRIAEMMAESVDPAVTGESRYPGEAT